MTEKYGVKEYLDEYKKILEQKPELPAEQSKTGKPNLIELLRAKKEQGKEWPLI